MVWYVPYAGGVVPLPAVAALGDLRCYGLMLRTHAPERSGFNQIVSKGPLQSRLLLHINLSD